MLKQNDILKVGMIVALLVFLYSTTPKPELKQSTFMFEKNCLQSGGDYHFQVDTSKAVMQPDYYCICSGEYIHYNPDEIFEGCKNEIKT